MALILEYIQTGLDTSIRFAPRIVIGIVLLVVGWKGSGLIAGALRKILVRRDVDPTLVKADQRILKDPEHLVVVGELADSSVNFTVRVWAKTEDYWGVFFDMHETVKKSFDSDGISIPFPQTDVHVHQS